MAILLDRYVVDARDPSTHQAAMAELPQRVAEGEETVVAIVVPFMREADRHAVPDSLLSLHSPRRRALIVFARAPVLGRVKTRLAAELGAAAALSVYRELAERVIAAVSTDVSYSVTVAFTPPESERAMREWLGAALALRPQSGGDLGTRMATAIADAISSGAERVVLIGTDCPDITARIVEEAFERLAGSDVVLGPASDGGYYLIGMSQLHRPLFDSIPWSSADTLRVTLESARAYGLSVALLDELRDVDTAADWRAWLASSGSSRELGR